MQVIQGMVSVLLGQEIGQDEPLMGAGLDSIAAVELRNHVSSKYGIDLPATVTFDQPSVKALAGYLAAILAPQQQLQLQPTSETSLLVCFSYLLDGFALAQAGWLANQ